MPALNKVILQVIKKSLENVHSDSKTKRFHLLHIKIPWPSLALTFKLLFNYFNVLKIFSFFRLLTLFRMKRRFRDVFGVTIILLPRLISAIIVLYLIYYFFAIIGMECFGKLELINCCKNSTVEQFYKNDTGKFILTLNDFIP